MDPRNMANNFNKFFSEMAESIGTWHLTNNNLLYAAMEAEVRPVIKNLKNTTLVGNERLKVSTPITPITSNINKFLKMVCFPMS
jgi:hypothetical protein